MITRVLPFVVTLAGVLAASDASAFDYAEAHSRAVKTCGAINPSESQTGLLFNPDGFRSFYVRSKYFQEAAVTFRDAALCSQVKERRSMFGSSWGYSEGRCRQLVASGAAADRRELEEIRRAYAAGGIRLRDVRIERNGNGRDTDIIPVLTGTYARGYTLTFELLPDAGTPRVLYTTGSYLDEKSNLRFYVPQATIKQQFPEFLLNRSYTLRARYRSMSASVRSPAPGARRSSSACSRLASARSPSPEKSRSNRLGRQSCHLADISGPRRVQLCAALPQSSRFHAAPVRHAN